MAEFIYTRDDQPDVVRIVITVPRRLWDRWESRHQHFGKAIHSLRHSVIEVLAVHALHGTSTDKGDPFWSGD